jgi:molybdopterin/thiamine biosynthesis adenylyltransferase
MSRLQREQARLRDAFPNLQLVERDGETVLEGAISVGEGTRHIRVGWPAAFPNEPPWLMEIDPTTGAWLLREAGADGLTHQFHDGTLCLFPHASSEGWHPARSTVEVVERFRDLVTSAIPAALPAPPPAAWRHIWLPPGLLAPMGQRNTHGLLTLRLASDVRMLTGSPWLVTSVLHETKKRVRTWNAGEQWAQAMRLPAKVTLPWSHPWTHKHLVDLAPHLTWSQAVSYFPVNLRPMVQQHGWCVLVRKSPQGLEVLLVCHIHGDRILPEFITPYDPQPDLFARLDGAVPGHEALREAHAVIIGCGSLGGEVARQLARAGVGHFTLFDGETMEVANVCRQIGGLPAIGQPMVMAVAREILSTNPLAQVHAVPAAITWDYALMQRATQHVLAPLLADPKTLFIITTATADLERGLNLLCVEARRPAVYASVLGRAEYGRVFRVLPGETPCYDCIAQTHAEAPGNHWIWTGEAAPGQPAYRQAGIPGLGMDIQQVALLAARLSLQTFRRIAPQLDYPDAHADHFVWSNHGGEGFDHPLQFRVERYARRPTCGICA